MFVAKHPLVVPFLVPLAPVPFAYPPPRLFGVGVSCVAVRTAKHPVVQLAEHLGRDNPANVIGPSPDDGVELPENCFDAMAPECEPGVAEFPNLGENRFLARLDKQFVPRPGGLRAR